MKLRRIFQLLVTSFLDQGITILAQLLVPPFFLRFYANGLAVYGEWIALSAAITYLGTLNYGVQTYAANQMTILYSGGDVRGARAVQASAFRLLLVLVALLAAGGLLVFVLPVASSLRLKTLSTHAASITLYLLILQIGVTMFFNLLTNSYMAVGLLHRSNYIISIQRLALVLGMSLLIFRRSSFPVLAGFQVTVLTVAMLGTLVDLRRIAPDLVPALSAGSWAEVKSILKPSGHFFLISIASFLTWQAPLLIIQRVLGAEVVGVFNLVRVVFQMSRQLLAIASGILSQDITLMVGRKEWKTLSRLYDLSERLVLFLIPAVSIGSLMLCPLLFTLWLHKRSMYHDHPVLCILMAMVSAVMGLKEHKMQFQQSSNQHEQLSKIMLIGYSVMLGASILSMWKFGLTGFVVTWLAWEIIQTAIVVRLNGQLFPEEHRIGTGMLLRFTWFIVLAFAVTIPPALREVTWPLWANVAAAALATAVLGGAAYFLFHLDELRVLLLYRIKNRATSPVTS